MMNYNLIVIGAGAAGLMTAAIASERGAKVLLLEKMEKVGRKIRITGKGRCNVTNNKSKDEFLSKVRAGADFVEQAFTEFDNFQTIAFFERIGVPISIEQGGRAYPKSGDAWDIANSLERYCKKKGCEIVCGVSVEKIETSENRCKGVTVLMDGKKRVISCDHVVIATGGVSYPGTGSTGDGYQMAYELGHHIEPVRPSLVPFEINNKYTSSLKGLILKNITIALLIDGVEKAKEQGEVEFFSFGIGGGALFRLSRDAVDALMDGHNIDFVIDLKPALSITKLLGRAAREIEQKPSLTQNQFLLKLMPSAIVPVVEQSLKTNRNRRIADMSDSELTDLFNTIKNLRFRASTHRGFKEAVVTAGGVMTSEIDARSMESKIVKGVYFAGEVMDIDADTGGYNLQLAFSTAYAAANNFTKDGSN